VIFLQQVTRVRAAIRDKIPAMRTVRPLNVHPSEGCRKKIRGDNMQTFKGMAVTLVAGFVLSAGAMQAQVGRDMKDAGHDTKDAGKTVGHDTAHDSKVVAHKTSSGTKKVYRKTAHGTSVGAHDTAHGTKVAADKTADVSKEGYHKTVNGTRTVGRKVEGKPAEPRSTTPPR
jgi:hypothetical protein